MTIVRRASPLGELISLRQAMDRLLVPTTDGSNGSRSLATGETSARSTAPAGA